MTLITRDDPSGCQWTSANSVPSAVRGRLVALAARALSALQVSCRLCVRCSWPYQEMILHQLFPPCWAAVCITDIPSAYCLGPCPRDCTQAHIFQANTSAQAALDAAFVAPLVDFDVVLTLRPSSVPDSQLDMQPASGVDVVEPADKQSSAQLQAVPYGELGLNWLVWWTSHLMPYLSTSSEIVFPLSPCIPAPARKCLPFWTQLYQHANALPQPIKLLTHRPTHAGVLIQGGLQAARSQLLVGFDPVALYLASLQQRFGHLGLFCAGIQGSCTIAIRWLPKVRGICQVFTVLTLSTHAAACHWPCLDGKCPLTHTGI